ncbi:MAG: VOC family protein [Aquabacterium sp.]|nr:VOC family protein [Aquabacterium sp.]
MPRPADPPAAPPFGLAYGRIAAQVCVADLPRALAFYVGVLGFDTVFENGEPVAFVILEKQGAELHLQLDPQHRASTHNVAHLMVNDAAALHGHLVAHGTPIVKALRDADYGLRTFVLADPDGNRIDVGQNL